MDFLKKYINDIFQVASRDDAREESYYSSLEELLREYANISGRKHIQITTLPKKTEAGNPDFRIWDGVQNIVGYIEAKNPQTENLDLIETTEQLQRYLNIFPNLILTNFLEFRLYRNETIIDKFPPVQNGEPSFEGDLLPYIYAILYSDVYRTKYDEFLRADFPAIPFTKNKEKFEQMRDLGERLAKLHLLMGPELDVRDFRLMGDDDRVREVRYDEENERVYINEKSYFERVKKEVWEYEIGTYQICRKWLEDRKGRSLSYDDISTYFRMVSAIEKTMEIQKEIDELYPQIEEELLEFEEEGEE